MNTIRKIKSMNQVTVFLLILACLCSVISFPAKAAEKVSIWLPVKQTVRTTGRTVSTDEQVFQYSLTPLETGNPMPEGSSEEEYILTLTGQQETKIQIDYDAEGFYTYYLRQVSDEARPGVTYDQEEYLITVQVKKGGSGGLVGDVSVEKSSSGMKAGTLEFTAICDESVAVPDNGPGNDPGEPQSTGDEGPILDNRNLDSAGPLSGLGRAVTIGEGLAGTLGRNFSLASDGEDLEELGSEETPRGLRNTDAWALVNLLFAIGTVLCTLILFIGYLRKRNKSEDEEAEVEEKTKMHGGLRIFSLVVSIASVIFFLLTEDVTLPLRLTDQYTWIMAAGFLIQILEIVYIRMNRKEKRENKAYT